MDWTARFQKARSRADCHDLVFPARLQSKNGLRLDTRGSDQQSCVHQPTQPPTSRAGLISTFANSSPRDRTHSTSFVDNTSSGSLPPRTLDRFKRLGTGSKSPTSGTSSSLLSPNYASQNASSTVSLPAHSIHYGQQQLASHSVEQFGNPRPSTSSVRGDDQDLDLITAPARKSRWKLGLGGGAAKRRSSGSQSVLGSYQSNAPPSTRSAVPMQTASSPSVAEDQNSGFFVRSFRTVSRVQQDPISTGPYESLRSSTAPTRAVQTSTTADAPQSPPLPALPPLSPPPLQTTRSRPSFDFADSPRSTASSVSRPPPQQRSSSESAGARGSNIYGHHASASYSGDRAPSPSTISVEAFRMATNSRTKSTVSLASLVDSPTTSLGLSAGAGDHDSTGQSSSRPRFEPSKSRRSSFRSDLVGESAGLGPSSPTGSLAHLALAPPRPSFAAHSRSSSAGSLTASSAISSSASSLNNRRLSATAVHPPVHTAITDEPASSNVTGALDRRPSHTRRSISSSETEIRLIGMYGGQTSPTDERPQTALFSTTALEQSQHARRGSVDREAGLSTSPVRSGRPAWAVQPPTPVGIGRMRTSSAMAAAPPRAAQTDKAAESKGKMKTGATAWNYDSSDEEAHDDSDSDDEVPLAQIQSRSQTDLRLPSPSSPSGMSQLRTFRSRSSVETTKSGGGMSSEQEILADPSSPSATSGRFSFDTMTSSTSKWRAIYGISSGSTLGRGPAPSKSAMRPMSDRSSAQRRSVSTLSFSNQLSAATSGFGTGQHATSASLSSQTPPSASLPMHPRSNSTPSSSMTIGVSTSIAPPPLEYLPSPTSPLMQQSVAIAAAAASVSPRVALGSPSSSAGTAKDYSPAVSDLGMRSAGSSGSTGASSLLGGSNGSGPAPLHSTAATRDASATSAVKTGAAPASSTFAFEDEVKRQVKFADESASATETHAHQPRVPGKQSSSMPIGAGGVAQRSSLPSSAHDAVDSNESSVVTGSARVHAQQKQQHAPTHRASMSSFTPSHEQRPSNASTARTLVNDQQSFTRAPGHNYSQSVSSLQQGPGGPDGANASVFDRMKARHKTEALEAIRIGKELNGTALEDSAVDDDDEDEDEPLASLPARRRGSQTALSGYGLQGQMPMGMGMMGYPAGPGSMYGGVASPMSQSGFQQQMYAPQSSFGGYSPLAVAPPGVDPFLCEPMLSRWRVSSQVLTAVHHFHRRLVTE